MSRRPVGLDPFDRLADDDGRGHESLVGGHRSDVTHAEQSTEPRGTYDAKTVQSMKLPGTWRAICSCGWRGTLRGGKGARGTAVSDRYKHLEEVSA